MNRNPKIKQEIVIRAQIEIIDKWKELSEFKLDECFMLLGGENKKEIYRAVGASELLLVEEEATGKPTHIEAVCLQDFTLRSIPSHFIAYPVKIDVKSSEND